MTNAKIYQGFLDNKKVESTDWHVGLKRQDHL